MGLIPIEYLRLAKHSELDDWEMMFGKYSRRLRYDHNRQQENADTKIASRIFNISSQVSMPNDERRRLHQVSEVIDLIDDETWQDFTENVGRKNFHFKNIDFRSYDFSNMKLENIVFENCMLPLSGQEITCKNVRLIHCQIPIYRDNPVDLVTLTKLFIAIFEEETFQLSSLVIEFFVQNINQQCLYLTIDNADAIKNELIYAIKNKKIKNIKKLLRSFEKNEDFAVSYQRHDSIRKAIAIMQGDIYTEEQQQDELYKLLEHKENASILLNQKIPGVPLIVFAARAPYSGLLNTLLQKESFYKTTLHQYGRVQNVGGITALAAAVYYQQLDNLKTILASNDCDAIALKQKGYQGINALFYAVMHNYFDAAEAIVQSRHFNETVLRERAYAGQIVLVTAAEKSDPKYIRLFLDNKYCNETILQTRSKKYGSNALMVAVACGHINTVKAILESEHFSEELFTQKNNEEKTAFELAEDKPEIKVILQEKYESLRKEKEKLHAAFLMVSNQENLTPLEKIQQFLANYTKMKRSSRFRNRLFNKTVHTPLSKLLVDMKQGLKNCENLSIENILPHIEQLEQHMKRDKISWTIRNLLLSQLDEFCQLPSSQSVMERKSTL